MKRKLVCIILLSTIALTACTGVQTENTESTESQTQSETTESEAEVETKKEKKIIKEVEVRTEVENAEKILDIRDMPNPECFYEDETYEYYFLKPMSEYIFVSYEDGSSEWIKEAFESGHVELGDFRYLYKVDIFIKAKNRAVGAEPKVVNIATRTLKRNWIELGVFEETFYEEGKYSYYYKNSPYSPTRSECIFVYYDDGTRENMRPALENGRITLEDLQAFQFGGRKELNIEKVVDLTVTGDATCAQEKEVVCVDKKYKFYLECAKSPYIELYYKNGQKETLRDLMDAGELTDDIMEELRDWDIEGLKSERIPSPVKEIQYSACDTPPKALDVKDVRGPWLVYEDEKYQYCLEFFGSVYVYYENGQKDHILMTALSKGYLTVFDMAKEGIGCFVCEKNPVEGAEPKLFYIVDSKIEAGATKAVFYEDATYTYSISDTNIAHIYAYYTDGTRQPIKEALKDGRITIADLDANGIEYTKEAK